VDGGAPHRRIYRREGDGYPSDPRDAEWARLRPLIPEASLRGRPRKTDMRAATNAILYLLRSGCPWRYQLGDALSTIFDCLLTSFASSSVMAFGECDLGRAAMALRATGPRGQPLGCGSQQPIGQLGRKTGGKDNQVGYDAGNQVKGRKIHPGR